MTGVFAGMPLGYLMLWMLIETSISPLMSTNCSNELVTVRVLERGQCGHFIGPNTYSYPQGAVSISVWPASNWHVGM